MSTIYLPNGGRIVIHKGWKSTTDASGQTVLRTHNDEYLGTIHTSGAVHLANECHHSYYPPATNLENAVEVVEREIEKVPYYKLKRLKEKLKSYNAVTHKWKN